VMATTDEDLKAYVEGGREKEGNGREEKLENGNLSGVGEEDEWTYPDGGLRAWLVVFVRLPFFVQAEVARTS
jgi:hypothetical protein